MRQKSTATLTISQTTIHKSMRILRCARSAQVLVGPTIFRWASAAIDDSIARQSTINPAGRETSKDFRIVFLLASQRSGGTRLVIETAKQPILSATNINRTGCSTK